MPHESSNAAVLPRLLLIEDNAFDARFIEGLVQREGFFHVEWVSNLTEGLEELSRDPPDVVVLDLELPDVVGLDGVRRLRTEHAQVPVVVLTAYDDVAVALEALKLSAEDYLIKGAIDHQGLHRSLVQAIEKQRAAAQLVRRRAIERTLSALSARFARASLESEEPFVEALRDLTELCGAERASLSMLSEGGRTADTLFQWSAPGIPARPLRQGLSLVGWALERLRAGEVIRLDDRSELTPRARRQYAPLVELGAQAALVLPLSMEGELGAFVSCELVTRPAPWSEVDFQSLGLATDLIGSALQRARTARALAQSEAQYRDLFEEAPLAYVAISPAQGLIRRCNHAAERLTQSTEAQLVGTRFAALFSPAPEATRLSEVLRSGGELADVELVRPGAEGEGRFVSLTVRPQHNDRREVTELRCAMLDTSERRRMRGSLVQAERLASMGILAGGIAHEVNNPLALLLLNLEELESAVAGLPDELRAHSEPIDQLVRTARGGADRIREIVGGLTSFSKSDAEFATPVNLLDALSAAAQVALNEVRYRARLVRHEVEVPLVRAVEGRLSQVFLSLIINAAQAIPEGDAEHHEVRLYTRAEGSEVLVVVEDTGVGIAPEDLPNLFEPFYTTKAPGLGTGLGLFICRNIVEAYGGRIEVESEVGRGSRFTVRLPAVLENGDGRRAARTNPSDRAEPARLLIVDDEPLIAQAVARSMASVAESTCVARGQEALEHLSTTDFDIILCDLMMPGVSGMDIYEWLTANRPELASRVIFMTGGAFTPRSQSFVARLPNPLLRKPFQMSAFKQLMLERLARMWGDKEEG